MMEPFRAHDWTLGTLAPLALIAVAGAVVPKLIARAMPRTLRAVAVNIGVSALVLLALGAGVMVAGYLALDPGFWSAMRADPAGALIWAARLGLLPIVIWAPVLAFVGLGIAQDVAGDGEGVE